MFTKVVVAGWVCRGRDSSVLFVIIVLKIVYSFVARMLMLCNGLTIKTQNDEKLTKISKTITSIKNNSWKSLFFREFLALVQVETVRE